MVSMNAYSPLVRYANQIHRELATADAHSESRLFNLYRTADEESKAAIVLAMIGELLAQQCRGTL